MHQHVPAVGRQKFADLDRFLGRHAVLSDSVGRHISILEKKEHMDILGLRLELN